MLRMYESLSPIGKGGGGSVRSLQKVFVVFQLFHCQISGILLIVKPSQQLMSMVVATQ